ncbi:MAG: 3-oxoacyl-[acyl-carrier-protein] reductase [Sphingomonadaceae bacterium]|uniref:3-oxoacyl-[acyl-carrier-protein] reductase n=1 Tax=Thermaurantiacus sp. TaxID=2820283 RepID=UPI00298F3C7D|nr:3-oxoacyl-[acyl-carrier-protein] reductase [Thermaurantiacus sp.]MCS6987638.1 3-oxoacyl-[acyl-carrier-protein] reductase [Sphingomonadaceae bacterium]MDW8415239.1 3-oxoacyl-[acyl-carrier-protein] reductase [Thermaurantiacus sp.]
MFDLTGRRALVTGATGAIGGAIAQALAARGARLALSGTRQEALSALAARFPGSVAVPARLDVVDEVETLVPRALEALGGLDILVNNAGITRDGLALRMRDDDWAAVLKVNLEAAFRLARAALRPMVRQRHGRIISIGSVVGTTGNAGQANYAAAKAGLVGLTKALAAEVAARGVTVNCVAPGFIRSAMTEGLPPAQKDALLTRIPAGRWGEGADVAAAVVFLASDEAAYVTGQTLHVNGGMAMP